MIPVEPIFQIGDEISWFQKIPWHKEDGPFVVVNTYDNNANACICGQKGRHQRTNICQNLPKQLVVVRLKTNNGILLDQHSGNPAIMASRFFRKVVE